mmetsp:Transcript_26958/g.25817  ORF Transcript_26958/g.25817 Transcript_26958/m.25817 type:complete len:193 (-) Transcript_26958:220-798(-)
MAHTGQLNKKNKFHKILMTYGKDIFYLAECMGKSMNSCLCYYYGCYKYTADYTRFKKMNKQERLRCEKVDLNLRKGDYCMKCNGYGDLICCDGCDNAFHAACISPPLTMIPDGAWHCKACAKKSRKHQESSTVGEDIVTTVDTTVRKRRSVDVSIRKDVLTRKPGSLCDKVTSTNFSLLSSPEKMGVNEINH